MGLPGAVEGLFKALGLGKRLAAKADKFLSLPWDRPDMSFEEQVLQFTRKVYPACLGCGSASARALQFMEAAEAEIRARMLERSLLEARGYAQASVKKFKSILYAYSGLDAQSLIASVPAIMVTLELIKSTEADLDKVRDPSTYKGRTFAGPSKFIYTSFNPDRIMNERPHKLLGATNASLVNQLTM